MTDSLNGFVKGFGVLVLVPLTMMACTSNISSPSSIDASPTTAGLRPLIEEERAEDFDALVWAIRENYGPLKYKEQRFGYKLDDLVQEYRVQALAAKSDAESTGVIKKFLTRLQDGHVGISGRVEKNEQYSVPVFLTPVENRVLVGALSEESFSLETGIEVGDEILEVDGQAPLSYLPTILKYETLGNAVTDQHMIFRLLKRPTYITELTPQKPTVALKVAKPDGTILERTLVWKLVPNTMYVPGTVVLKDILNTAYSANTQEIIQASLTEMGDETPFYMKPRVVETFKIVQINPSEKYLKKHGLKDMSKTPKMYAGLYRYEGQNILLIRQAGYMVSDPQERIAWYKALLEEYGPLADKLVLDQTHNPGGSLTYALDFMSLFAKGQTRSLVNFLRADRKWLSLLGRGLREMRQAGIESEMGRSLELMYKLVESAYDKGLHLTETPVNFVGSDYLSAASVTFDKPILLLVDELAGSCGDILPALMKENKTATLFGERTIGLGGNVEEVVALPNSQITVNLTRGLFYVYSPGGEYNMNQAVENNGVTPDIPYQHTVKDVRAGYVDYVKAFSKAAVELK